MRDSNACDVLAGKMGPMAGHTPYQFLEQRPGSNSRQWFLRGRNLLAEVVYRATIGPEPRTPDEVAQDHGIPRAAVDEAVDYGRRHADVIQYEREDVLTNIRQRGLDTPPCAPAEGVPGA